VNGFVKYNKQNNKEQPGTRDAKIGTAIERTVCQVCSLCLSLWVLENSNNPSEAVSPLE